MRTEIPLGAHNFGTVQPLAHVFSFFYILKFITFLKIFICVRMNSCICYRFVMDYITQELDN